MTPNSSIAETAWSQCEVVIRQFEDAWHTHGRADVGAFVPADFPMRTRLLVELVHVDLEFRLRANEDARVEDYLGRFAELHGKDLTLDLIAAEYALRARYRPPVVPAEFWLRFPKHEDELRALLTASAPQQTRAAPTESPASLTGPPLIPGCQIQGELGRGGMGIVYKARDLLLNRHVAVKTVSAVPSQEARARFAREAESIARLDHPNIVPVYDVGEWGPDAGPRVPYFTMKWYPGGSLDAVPSGIGTDATSHAQVIETIAKAVHHAHRRGVLHLDLKPSNILLDDQGAPHVADFGLAGWFDPADPRSVLGGAVGTPAYMAPEQARPAGRVTLAADVYGLGAVLYQLLTGHPPFEAATAMATLDRVMNAPPERPSKVNPDVPLDLEAVCLKCLDKEPAKRYHTAEEVADDLARWRTGRPVLARPTPAPERAWRLIRRHPMLSGMALTTFAALVFVIVVLAISNAQVRTKESEAQAALQRERDARGDLNATLEREQRSLYLERAAAAGRLYQMNHLEQAWHTLDQCPPKYRGWEWQYLEGQRKTQPTVWRGDPGGVYLLAFLADGRLISLGRSDGKQPILVWNPDGTSRPLAANADRVTTHPTRNWAVFNGESGATIWDVDANQPLRQLPGRDWAAFTPDGKLFVAAQDSVVRLYTAGTWEPAGELTGVTGFASAGAFSPDNRVLYLGTRDGTIRAWNLSTRELVGGPWRRPSPILDLAVAANGKALIEALPSRLQISDAATGQVTRGPEVASSWPYLTVSSDGTWFATNTVTSEVVVRHAETGQVLRTYRGHASPVFGIALDRTGTRLASCDNDGVIQIANPTTTSEFTDLATDNRFGHLSLAGTRLLIGLRAFHTRGKETTRVVDLTTRKELLSFPGWGEAVIDPAGRWIVTGKGSGNLVLHDAETGAERKTIADKAGASRLRFSASGRHLAALDMPNTVRIWPTDTWAEAKPLLKSELTVYAFAWSPVGESLAVAQAQGVELWDVATRTRTWLIPTPQESLAVAFSPASDVLAVAGRGRQLTLYDAKTGQPVRPFIGNSSIVNAMAFHPRGNRLATASADGKVRIWDVDSGQQVLTLDGGEKELFGVVWTADGRELIASGSVVRSWRTP